VLTAGFAAHTGLDAAGTVFGLAYQDAAEQLLKGAAAAVNACRQTGARIQQGAANYSRAEAASTLGGGAGVLSSPPEPATIAAPGPPGTWGKGEPPPLLWAVVESFVDDVWPDGDVAGLHAAAARWRSFGTAASGMQSALNASKALLDGQQIPERNKIDAALSQIGGCLGQLGVASGTLATSLDKFADEVDQAHNHIRDLLNGLGSLTDLGHDLMLIVKGDALDEIKKIARDINGVLHDLGREARAAEQGMKLGMQIIDGAIVKLEKHVRGELKDFLGDAVGNQVATVFDFWLNANEGVLKGAVGIVFTMADLDPRWFLVDPEGAAAPWSDTAKSLWKGSVINAFLNPQEAGQAKLQELKSLLHIADWSWARPGLGFGENVFDVATLITPGAGEAGVAADGAQVAARGGEAAADAAGTAGRAGGRAAGGVAGGAGARGALADVTRAGGDLTKNLEGVTGNLSKIEPPLVGGRPVGLPPGKPFEPPVESAPRPPDGAPPGGPTAAPGPTAPEPPKPVGGEPAPAGGPQEPGGGQPPAPAPASPPGGGPHEPGPEPVPVGAPHDAGSSPAGGPHEPAMLPVGTPHEPVHATAPGSTPSAVPAAVGDRLPSTVSSAAAVPPSGSPAELAPATAHAPETAQSFSTTAPHASPPGGRPTELPDRVSEHGPGDGGSPGGSPHGKSPHGGGPHGPGEQGPPRDGYGGGADDHPHDQPLADATPDGSDDGQNAGKGRPPTAREVFPDANEYGDLTKDQYEHEFIDETGQTRYPDEDDPTKPYAVPGTVRDMTPTDIMNELDGNFIDRIGHPRGRWLAPEETPYEGRSLPRESLDMDYHVYKVHAEVGLPRGWVIEKSTAASWFGHSGGGIQYRLVPPKNGKASVEELEGRGFLKDVGHLFFGSES